MPRLSRQTKEIIQTVAVLLIVAALVFVYVIYPLNRVKATMGRADFDTYQADSLPPNDVTVYTELGLAPDTFRIEADGWTTLACLYLLPDSLTWEQPKGTVFLLHSDGADRDSMATLAKLMVDSGYAVIAYDQRASGRSTGKYRGEGQLEAADLEELIRFLDLRGRIRHPVIIIGTKLGADAGLLATLEEKRVDAVVAINPYLTTRRLQDILKKQYRMFWFPFFRSIMWWWYGIRSSYAAPYRTIDDLKPVTRPTLLLVSEEMKEEAAVRRLAEISQKEKLTIKTLPTKKEEAYREIFQFLERLPQSSPKP